jgi:IS5 family transposase
LSDPTMEEALHDTPLFKEFVGLDSWNTPLPDETAILRFRHLLEKHRLAEHMLRVINDLLGRKGLLLRWCTRCGVRLAMSRTWPKPMRCCMGKNTLSLVMLAIKAQTSARGPSRVWSG